MNNRKTSRKISLQPYVQVEKKFLGGLLDSVKKGLGRVKEGFSALFGSNRLPKSFRDTLEKHKDKNIVNIQVCREPLSKAVSTFANLITAGTFNKVANKQGPDGFFHVFSILTLNDGTKLIHEFNERPVLQVSNIQPSDKAQCVLVNSNIQLGEFIEKSIKKRGEDKYIEYDPINNNCQDHLLASLQANDLATPEITKFLKQNTEDLIEQTPSFSKLLATKATGIGGTLRQVWEELTARRGRVIIRHDM